MRTTLYCLIIALILRVAFDDYVTAQQVHVAPPKTEVQFIKPSELPGTYTFADPLHGSWLTIGRVNYKDDPNGFDPCWTYIKVNAKPIVKRIAKDQYEITFTSEIAENLP